MKYLIKLLLNIIVLSLFLEWINNNALISHVDWKRV